MRHVSLFSGVGGFDLGLERSGLATVGQCELDPRARSVLRRHWPDVPRHDDIRTLHGMTFGPADVVTFGSPCQDLSVAGAREGMAGERSGLFLEAVRFLHEMRWETGGQYPRFALWENVPGAFSTRGGADFAAVLGAFRDLGALDITWRVLDSRHFGVAQRRRRVYLAADFGGERAAEVLLEPESVRRDSPAGEEAGQIVTGTLDARTTAGGFPGSDGAAAWHVVPAVYTGDGLTADPLTAHEGKTWTHEGVTFRLRNCVHNKLGVRRLTPRECERLQGFPDDHTRWDDEGREIADTPRYRMIGNAVTVNVAHWLGQCLRHAA